MPRPQRAVRQQGARLSGQHSAHRRVYQGSSSGGRPQTAVCAHEDLRYGELLEEVYVRYVWPARLRMFPPAEKVFPLGRFERKAPCRRQQCPRARHCVDASHSAF